MVEILPKKNNNMLIKFSNASFIIAKLSNVYNNPCIVMRIYPVVAKMLINKELTREHARDIFQIALDTAFSGFILKQCERDTFERYKERLFEALID